MAEQTIYPAIYPTDSVLLGIAYGEYLHLKAIRQNDRLLDVIGRRVGPFVPWRRHNSGKEMPVDKSGVPAGIEWVKWTDGTQIALTWMDGRIVEFIERGGKYFRMADDSEGSLLDSLIEYFTHGTEKLDTRWDDISPFLITHWPVGTNPSPRPSWAAPLVENVEDIIDRIQRLIVKNELNSTFDAGKLLGKAFGECEAIERELRPCCEYVQLLREAAPYEFNNCSSVWDLEDQILKGLGDDWIDRLNNCWKELKIELPKHTPLRACALSEFIFDFQYDFDYASPGAFGLGNVDAWLIPIINVRTNLSFMLGELLGTLHDKDIEPRYTGLRWLPRSPRNMKQRDGFDRVTGGLNAVDRVIEDMRSRNYAAVTIIDILCNQIGAIGRLVWNDWPETDLPEYLRRKLNPSANATRPEQRFARTALTLHKDYRNPAVHSNVSFTYEDAQHCLSNLGILKQEAERILRDRDSARNHPSSVPRRKNR